MIQTDKLNYRVTDGEEVTVRVVPVGANGTVTLSFGGKDTEKKPPSDGLRYSFKVLRSNGTPQILGVRGDFMVDDSPDAKFVITFDPDAGKPLDGHVIRRPPPEMLQFGKNEYFFTFA